MQRAQGTGEGIERGRRASTSSEYVGGLNGERKHQAQCPDGRGEPEASLLLKRKRTAQSACILTGTQKAGTWPEQHASSRPVTGQSHADDHRSHHSDRGHQSDTLSRSGRPPVGPPRTAHKLKKRQK